ncbi:MAG TPA: type II toxin-antitoxin system prevent-host-death family antitoxin [Actinophytocola sp.]|uniref:type II toxin-antitoxin system Phd/YefM family antitoxin n=1 Tax=Actinophytocola sp. TaxID=1872138 RepID=UPI002DDCBB1B|nr:type II toxin-antitoxin system prevent-host-death family antitoxin [Actinophytocola sp.]HEV2782689.1 type II toxin-antitoxin system prevent-host-death family antitoxin [Actinophytocola sp.]
METIGVRELRQNASKYLRRVAAGESFTVTDRGTPVAALVPPPRVERSLYEEMVARGELIPAEDPDRKAWLEPPLPLRPGETPLSEVLQQMRDEERY